MVLNNCTVCIVYEEEESVQKRIRVKCFGDQITLYLKRENEISESEKIRIDFFDGDIGCIKTYCRLSIRTNYLAPPSEQLTADCEVLDVIEIVKGRRSLRARLEKEIMVTSPRWGEFFVDVQNVSEGGIYFVTRTKLHSEDAVEFDFSFMKKEYQLRAVVVREEDFRDGQYGYGCQFAELSLDAVRDIKQYVLQSRNRRIR